MAGTLPAITFPDLGLNMVHIEDLAAGILLETTSSRATVAVFTMCGVVLAVWGTLSPAIRDAPRLEQAWDQSPSQSRLPPEAGRAPGS